MLIALFLVALLGGCLGSVPNDPTLYTFQLSQSIPSFLVWTAPNAQRITNLNVAVPPSVRSSLFVSCAKNEFESFQLIIAPTNVNVFNISLNTVPFPAGSTAAIGLATFSDVNATFAVTNTIVPLDPLNDNKITPNATTPTVVWFTVYVPPTAPAGTFSTMISLTIPSLSQIINIPIELYVYNFAIPTTPHFNSFIHGLPVRLPAFPQSQASFDVWRRVYLDHRLTSVGPTWPSAFGPSLLNCSTGLLNVELTSDCPNSIGCNVKRVITGEAITWNGVLYPAWAAGGHNIICPLRTDGGLTAYVCGVSCANISGDCGVVYNTNWRTYLASVESWLKSESLENRIVYYIGELGDPAQHVYRCNMSKTAAPSLPIMSGTWGALRTIVENPSSNLYTCNSVDIWLTHTTAHDISYSWFRQKNFGEQVWWITQFDDGFGHMIAPETSFALNTAYSEGMHYRIIPWAAWSMRVQGWGSYNGPAFFDASPVSPAPAYPRYSAELLREGFDDYEYLFLANKNQYPPAMSVNPVDETVRSLAFCQTVWANDPAAAMALRHALGQYLEGTLTSLPSLSVAAQSNRSVGNYYVVFTYPPAPGDLTSINYNGSTWIKAGWTPYSPTEGFGWCANLLGTNILLYENVTSTNPITQVNLLDNYGNNINTFFFQLPDGVYMVTVAVGKDGQCTSDPEHIEVQGIILRNAPQGPPCYNGTREYSMQVDVMGSLLLVRFGIGYVRPNFLKMEYVEPLTAATTTAPVVTTASPATSCGNPLPIPELTCVNGAWQSPPSANITITVPLIQQTAPLIINGSITVPLTNPNIVWNITYANTSMLVISGNASFGGMLVITLPNPPQSNTSSIVIGSIGNITRNFDAIQLTYPGSCNSPSQTTFNQNQFSVLFDPTSCNSKRSNKKTIIIAVTSSIGGLILIVIIIIVVFNMLRKRGKARRLFTTSHKDTNL